MGRPLISSRIARIAGYALYAVALTVLLIYWRFPTGLLRSWIEDRLTTLTQEPVSVAHASLEIPGFRMEGVRVEILGGGPDSTALRLDTVSADFSPFAWLRGERSLNISGKIYGGKLRGKALLEGKNPERLYVKARFDGVDAGRIPMQLPWGKLVLKGTARGEVELWFSTDPKVFPRGKMSVESRNGEAREISLGAVRLPDLPYESLKARLALQGGAPAIEDVQVAGGYGEIRLTPERHATTPGGKAPAGPAGLVVTVKASPHLKTRFPLLWGLLQKLPRSNGAYRILIPAAASSS